MIQSSLGLQEVLLSRHSVRRFLPKAVSMEQINTLLELASHAPSSSNMQLWRVYVLQGSAKKRLSDLLVNAFRDPDQTKYKLDINYAEPPRQEYLERHEIMSKAFYGSLGLAEADMPGLLAQIERNYRFFDAPVGLILTTDRTMQQPAWLDCGLFLNSLMLAAQSMGLATCAQASFCTYHRVIAEVLHLPFHEMVVCGVSLGYEDKEALENQFRSTRLGVNEFAVFVQ
jgi:nitroreductase